MRRLLASLLAGGLLATAAAAPVAAQDPVSINPYGTELIANGVGVNVWFDIVCEPIEGSADLNLEYAYVQIDQAVGKKAITSGRAEFGGGIACDGATVNSYVIYVRAESVPFQKGDAYMKVYAYIMDWDNWEAPPESGTWADAVELTKLKIKF